MNPDLPQYNKKDEKDAPLKRPALLWLHSGGWTLGSINTDDKKCALLAKTSNVVVVSVAYRLAPEYVFPAPIDDTLSVLLWITDSLRNIHSQEAYKIFDIDPTRVFIGGESSGGNVIAGALQHLYALPTKYKNSVSYAHQPQEGRKAAKVQRYKYKVTGALKAKVSSRYVPGSLLFRLLL